ncbi:MAG: hypothetical protein ACJAQT_003196 [Akkermansiaceae bacterium]|jgi:hypothetical protein
MASQGKVPVHHQTDPFFGQFTKKRQNNTPRGQSQYFRKNMPPATLFSLDQKSPKPGSDKKMAKLDGAVTN